MELGFGLYKYRDDADKLLTAYLQQGGDLIDAASNYSKGEAHALIAKNNQVKARADKLKIWSKIGFARCAATLKKRIDAGLIEASEVVENHALNARLVRHQIAETCAELEGINLDAIYLHNPERQFGRLSKKEFWSLMAECISELEIACAAGLIRRWGISTWHGLENHTGKSPPFSIGEWETTARNVAGNSHHFELVQMPLNLSRVGVIANFVQKGLGPIQEAVHFGKVLIGSSPMAGGALPPVLNNEFTELFGRTVSPGQACLLFLAAIPEISICLISPRNIRQLNDSLTATRLSAPDREALSRLIHFLVDS